jgi:hypothetical protein
MIALAALAAALCTIAATAALAAPRTAAEHSAVRTHSLDGTWTTHVRLTDAPPGVPSDFEALDTFVRGGELLVSSSAAMPATRSLAHGSWTRTSRRHAQSSFRWFRFDPSGQFVGTQRVVRTMRVSRGGATFHADDVITLLSPTGAVVATIHGTEVGKRLAG